MRHGLEVAKGKYAGKLAYVDHYIDKIIADESYLPTTYLISFSRDFDSLSQWRGYSQQSIGVALGFNDERLARVAHLYGFRRLECVYKIGQKQALFEEQIETWRKHFEKLEEEVKKNPESVMARHSVGRFATMGQHGELDTFLRDIAPRLKHDAFEYEAEVRLVSTDQVVARDYRCRNGLMVPYLKLPIGVKEATDRANEIDPSKAADIANPLIGVLIGPTAEPAITRNLCESFQMWLREEGFDVTVAVSDTPLRT